MAQDAVPPRLDKGSAREKFVGLWDRGMGIVRELQHGDCDTRRTQRKAFLAFVIRVTSAALAYLSQVFLARWMGTHEYGIFAVVWVWVLILGGLSPLGLNTAIIRFVPEYFELGKFGKLRGVLFGARAVTFLCGTVVALLGLAGLYFIGDGIAHYYVLPAYLALICVPLYALTDINDAVCRSKSWIMLGLVPPFVLRPLLILLTTLGAYLYGLPMVATTAVGAAIFATWFVGLLQHILLHKSLTDDVPQGERAYDLGFWMKVSLPLLFINGSELFLQNTDVVIISKYMTPTDVGIYFAALKTMSLVSFVHFAVGAAVANRFSALKANEAEEELKAFVRQSVHWTFWPSLVATFGILALGWPLLYMFGEAFTSGYPVMFVLAVGFVVRASMGPAEFVLNMLGEHRRCAAIFFITAGFNVVSNILLVQKFGLMGAAFSTAVSMILAAFMFYRVAKRHLDIELAIWRHFRG